MLRIVLLLASVAVFLPACGGGFNKCKEATKPEDCVNKKLFAKPSSTVCYWDKASKSCKDKVGGPYNGPY